MPFPSDPNINGPIGSDGHNLRTWISAVRAWAGGISGPDLAFVDARGGPVDYDLPAGSGGASVTVKDTYGVSRTNNITVRGAGIDLIDGSPTLVIDQDFGAYTLAWNGEGWSIV